MRGMVVKLLVVVVCSVFLTGCFETDSTVQGLRDENSRLNSSLTEMRGEKTRLEGDLQAMRTECDLARADADGWHKKYLGVSGIAPSGGVSPEVLAKFMAIARTGSHWELKGTVLRAEADILFASGKADLKPEAKAAITEVAPTLKEILSDKSVVLRVDGHTDSDPISRSGWKDNLHLSLMRARAVALALQEQGVPATAVFAAGWGETHPIAGAPKDKNRRVELVIVPAGQ